ncbi:MAG: hypothetical protein LIO90_00275 [Bacteroidales bacterium]|nr:hypothetical protein [Bacteroidales bacterium]
MKKTWLLAILPALLYGCQSSGNQMSREEIEAIVDARIEAKLAENPSARPQGSSSSSSGDGFSSSSRSSSSSSSVDDPQNWVGTYEFSDDFNTWEITVNPDETCTIVNKSKGGETIGYGSWRHYNLYGGHYGVSFDDLVPQVWFEGEGDFSRLSRPDITDDLQWIYKDDSSLKAKNPKKRLPLRKTS